MIIPELRHKKAIVTGVNSGIGLAQANALLEQGTIVVGIDLTIDRSHKLEQQFPGQLTLLQCDLRDEAALNATAQQALTQLGGCDYLLNTAGVLDAYAPTLKTSSQQWDAVMAVNLKAQFLLTNAVLPTMLAQGHGVCLNMASIAGFVAGGGGAVYTAAKHAIIGYTKQLDYDYAAQGIRANCIAPGAIETPMNAADFAGKAEMAHWVAEQTPAKRWAQPEEVAALSLFLISPAADYIHGSVVPIDGGWTEK